MTTKILRAFRDAVLLRWTCLLCAREVDNDVTRCPWCSPSKVI